MDFPKGTKIMIMEDGKKYTITSSNLLRGKYYYNLSDEFGKKFSLNRLTLLQAIEENKIKII